MLLFNYMLVTLTERITFFWWKTVQLNKWFFSPSLLYLIYLYFFATSFFAFIIWRVFVLIHTISFILITCHFWNESEEKNHKNINSYSCVAYFMSFHILSIYLFIPPIVENNKKNQFLLSPDWPILLFVNSIDKLVIELRHYKNWVEHRYIQAEGSKPLMENYENTMLFIHIAIIQSIYYYTVVWELCYQCLG